MSRNKKLNIYFCVGYFQLNWVAHLNVFYNPGDHRGGHRVPVGLSSLIALTLQDTHTFHADQYVMQSRLKRISNNNTLIWQSF